MMRSRSATGSCVGYPRRSAVTLLSGGISVIVAHSLMDGQVPRMRGVQYLEGTENLAADPDEGGDEGRKHRGTAPVTALPLGLADCTADREPAGAAGQPPRERSDPGDQSPAPVERVPGPTEPPGPPTVPGAPVPAGPAAPAAALSGAADPA